MKAKDGDMCVVMGIKNLDGRQFDLRLQSREKAHDVILVGWLWTGKITHEPQALPARRWARHVGASEHSSASAIAGAPEHGVEPPAIPVNPSNDKYESLPEEDVDWTANEDEDAEEEEQAEEIWMASQMLWMVSQVLPAFADTGG